MKAIQQELELFPAPSFEDIIAENKISGLSITFNKRLHKSWHLTIKPNKQKSMVVPYLLKDAPENTKKAVISWALLLKPRLKKNKKIYYQQKKHLENQVWDYLEKQGVTSKRKKINNPQKFALRTNGTVYDLQLLFEDINLRYFDGKIKSYIRWGTYGSRTSNQSYCTDQNGDRFSLITIAGVYNHPKVPEFAIRGVLFHEMLHIAILPYKKNGRNVMHGPEFKKAERSYKDLKKWNIWEKKELYKIIRAMKSR